MNSWFFRLLTSKVATVRITLLLPRYHFNKPVNHNLIFARFQSHRIEMNATGIGFGYGYGGITGHQPIYNLIPADTRYLIVNGNQTRSTI